MTTVQEQPVRQAGGTRLGGFSMAALGPRWRRAITGSAWSGGGFMASQLLRMASTVLLARTALSPDDFGLMTTILVFIAGLEMISDLGIGTNVVQSSRGDEPRFLRTAFSLQCVRGLGLWAIAVLLAYPYVVTFGPPESSHGTLFWMMAVAAANVVIRGLASSSYVFCCTLLNIFRRFKVLC